MTIPVVHIEAEELREELAGRYGQLPEPASTAVEPGRGMSRERELRALCRRMFGWDPERSSFVNDMMHAVLAAVARGSPIALRGEPDLVPVAYALHRCLLGPARPFIVCDPRRREGDGSVRSPPNRRTGLRAAEAAKGGAVCIHSNHLPSDFEELALSLRKLGSIAMLFVCLHERDRVRDLLSPPIEIPPLAARTGELECLLDEFLEGAARALGVRRVQLPRRMRESVLRRVESLPELETTALRLVALASSRSVNQAAHRLHMTHVSLAGWLRRRCWSAAHLTDESDDAVNAPPNNASRGTEICNPAPRRAHGPVRLAPSVGAQSR